MARSRNIKPSIMVNEELAELEPMTRLLFIYLWMLADRQGRLEDKPKRIAAQALPYDRDADVVAMLEALQTMGFISRYSVDGLPCIQITAFHKHQSPHVREIDSVLPGPEDAAEKVVTEHDLGSAEPSPRSPDSGFLIPDTGYLIPDCGKTQAQPTPPTRKVRAVKVPMPEGFSVSDKVSAWAEKNGFGQLDLHLDAFTRKASMNAYTYANWDAAFMEAIREDWAKIRQKAGKQPESFREADQKANALRYAAFTGQSKAGNVIDITPKKPRDRL